MLEVVVAIVVVVVLMLPTAADLLIEVFGAAEELVSMEMLASIIFGLVCPAPNVKRASVQRKINSCQHLIVCSIISIRLICRITGISTYA